MRPQDCQFEYHGINDLHLSQRRIHSFRVHRRLSNCEKNPMLHKQPTSDHNSRRPRGSIFIKISWTDRKSPSSFNIPMSKADARRSLLKRAKSRGRGSDRTTAALRAPASRRRPRPLAPFAAARARPVRPARAGRSAPPASFCLHGRPGQGGLARTRHACSGCIWSFQSTGPERFIAPSLPAPRLPVRGAAGSNTAAPRRGVPRSFQWTGRRISTAARFDL